MTPSSPTAQMLTKAIQNSGLTHLAIAERVGIQKPSVLKMIEQGLTRVPLDRIPALAQTLGMDQAEFLLLAVEEYHSGVFEVLSDTLGLPYSDAEQGLVVMFSMASLKQDFGLEGSFKKALEGIMELAEAAHC